MPEPARQLTILHSSDWHLGQTLYGRKRYAEFEALLDWMLELIEQKAVDVLLLAGDLFDSNTPSNKSQALYYHFLQRVAESSCRHLIAIGGNHDSPTFLDAPKPLLAELNIHIVGAVPETRDEEVLLLDDAAGEPVLLVCAVPYLRDRDLRLAESDESVADKEQKLVEGIRSHYAEVVQLAEQQRRALGRPNLPIVAMGHLFAAGGRVNEGDGVRELYIGSLAKVPGDLFPKALDYVALGHLHAPQRVQGLEHRRYSGAPLALGFAEAGQEKSICLLHFERSIASDADGNSDSSSAACCPQVQLVPVPCFQPLARIQGDQDSLIHQLQKLASTGIPTWLEVTYTGRTAIDLLRPELEAALADSSLEMLCLKSAALLERALGQVDGDERLEDLSLEEVFTRCLRAHDVPEEEQAELRQSYREILRFLNEEDLQAE